MIKRKYLIYIIIGIILLIATILVVKQFIVINPKEEISNEYTPMQEIADSDLRNTIVTLYFKSKDSNTLVQEGRLIDVKLLLEKPYETLLQMLILGPDASSYEKLIPAGTTINKTELKGDTLEIDFSKDFSNNTGELLNLTIESIKKTITSLNEVNNVIIFVDGKEIKS